MDVYGIVIGEDYDGCSISTDLYPEEEKARLFALQEIQRLENPECEIEIPHEPYKEIQRNFWKSRFKYVQVLKFTIKK